MLKIVKPVFILRKQVLSLFYEQADFMDTDDRTEPDTHGAHPHTGELDP